MQKVWNILWKQFECATNEFNAYIDGGIPAIAQQKIAKFIKEWDKLKEQAMKFDDTGNGSRFFLPNSQTVHQHEKRKESPHQMCRGKESQRIFQRN